MDRWTDLAIVAHELGNALAPTRNAVGLLSRANTKRTAHEEHLLVAAERGLERAERVLRNLASLALLEERELQSRPTELQPLLTSLSRDLRSEAETRRIHLDVHVQSGLGPIPVDRDALDSVLVNLVTNALKFTPAGGSVRLLASAARGVVLPGRLLLLAGGFGCTPRFVHIRVVDTGVGISDATRRRLFQPFFRGREAATTPGMGLGLAVSYRLVHRLHGDLRAESRRRGASLLVTLPADAATQKLVERVEATVRDLDARLRRSACSVAVLRDPGARLPAESVQAALRARLGDPQCHLGAVSDTTALAWSTQPMRAFAHALGAALHDAVGNAGGARLRVALRRAARGQAADPLLLQAAVRCRHGVSVLRSKRGVPSWPES